MMPGRKCPFQDCDNRQASGDVWTTMTIEGRRYEVCAACAEKTGAFMAVGDALVRER